MKNGTFEMKKFSNTWKNYQSFGKLAVGNNENKNMEYQN